MHGTAGQRCYRAERICAGQAPMFDRTGQPPPEPCAQVRILLGAQGLYQRECHAELLEHRPSSSSAAVSARRGMPAGDSLHSLYAPAMILSVADGSSRLTRTGISPSPSYGADRRHGTGRGGSLRRRRTGCRRSCGSIVLTLLPSAILGRRADPRLRQRLATPIGPAAPGCRRYPVARCHSPRSLAG
jgi:hypothetical protein